MSKPKIYTPEERRARDNASKARYKAKKLAASQVAASDRGRELAERNAGQAGPGRPGGTEPKRAASVEEATARVVSSKPAATTTKAPAGTPPPEWREPTKGEVAQIRFFMKQANKPLVQLERDFEAEGILGPEAPPALVKRGEIKMGKGELDMGAQCTAGTLITFAPSIMPYLAPIGLACWAVGFLGSRLMVLWRINRAMKVMEAQAAEQTRLREQAKGKPLNPTAVNGERERVPAGEITKISGN